MLCLMRYQDWTFRQAESRLAEPSRLARSFAFALWARRHDAVSLFAAARRGPVARGLGETVRRLRRGKTQVRVSCAIDGTGVSPHAVRTYFLRRSEQQNGGKKCFRHYWQWLIVVDGKQQILLHNQRGKDLVDPRALPGLGDAAARLAPLRLVLAEAEFDSEANPLPIRQRWRAQSIIPAQPRRGVPQGTLRGQMYRNFPAETVRTTAKVETVFSVVKRKLSARAPGRRLVRQVRQALLLGLTYNLYRLSIAPLGEDVNRAT